MDIFFSKKSRKEKGRGKRYFFIGHTMDQSGAPFIFLDVIREFAEKYGAEKVTLLCAAIDEENASTLKEMGIEYKIHPKGSVSRKELKDLINVDFNDTVVLNTLGVNQDIRDHIFAWLEEGSLKHAHFYVHENHPSMFTQNTALFERIDKLTASGLLDYHLLTEQMIENYRELLKNDIKVSPYQFRLDSKYSIKKTERDFDEITFVLNGTSSGGGKGQFLALTAFIQFLNAKFIPEQKDYRNFKLLFVGLKKDYISDQLITIGEELLGERFEYRYQMPRAEVLELMTKADVNITTSMSESFPVNIMESMYMGHILLRNGVSGYKEQLADGINGFAIDSNKISSIVEGIDKTLNKESISNAELLKMSQASQKMIEKFRDVSYTEYFK